MTGEKKRWRHLKLVQKAEHSNYTDYTQVNRLDILADRKSMCFNIFLQQIRRRNIRQCSVIH